MKLITVYLFLIILLSSCGEKTFRPEKSIIELKETSKIVTLSKGQKAFYQAKSHGSVGIKEKVSVADKTLLKIIRTKRNYAHPDKTKLPGGDAATVTYIFEALEKGETKITIQKIFRGDLQVEHKIKCLIE